MKKILCSIAVILMIISILACSVTNVLIRPAPTPTELPFGPIQPLPTFTQLPDNTTIISKKALSPQENQTLVDEALSVNQGGRLLDWAVGYGILGGYTPIAGAEIVTEGGDLYRGVALKNAQLIKYSIQGNPAQKVYFLAQVTGTLTDPNLVLIMDQNSTTIYSKDGVQVNGKKDWPN